MSNMKSLDFPTLCLPLVLLFSGCQQNLYVNQDIAQVVDPKNDARPNILLIVADDMGFTDIGAFGGEIPTPNIDSLAADGIRLANFHAAPVCSPARAMLMSGMDSHEAGIASMEIKRAFDDGKLPPKNVSGYGNRGYEGYLSPFVASLPEVLQRSGYNTYMVGKWDLGRALVEEHNPAGRGFDRSFVQTTGTAVHFPAKVGAADGGIARAEPLIYRRDWDVVNDLPNEYFSSNYFVDELNSYLSAQDNNRPFFAYLAFTAPHFPLQAPDEWIAKFKNVYNDGYDVVRDRRVAAAVRRGILPENVSLKGYQSEAPAWDELTEEEKTVYARKMEVYAAMVANMDYNIGRVLDLLRSQNKFENTVVLFMSDNGAADSFPERMAEPYDNSFNNLGKRGSFMGYGRGWAEASMAPLRGVKGSLAEGGVRAAAILTNRNAGIKGGVSHSYLTVQDVMPTLLDLARVEHPGAQFNYRPSLPMRGKSMAPLLAQSSSVIHPADEPIGWEFEGQRALVKGQYKILSFKDSDVWLLFDLEQDPGEQQDLSENLSEIKQELVKDWHTYADDVGVFR